MATSGLDHDVKIWSPTATEETDLSGLPRVMKQNERERDDEGRSQSSEAQRALDSHVLWFLMHNLRHRARTQRWRRRVGDEGDTRDTSDDGDDDGDDDDDDDDDDDGENDDDDDDDDDDASNERVQCVPS
ncbi:DDB1- and CUL4-associated factor 8-like [Lampetra fluviatilis]